MPIKAFRESLILHFLTGKSSENLAIGREKCEISGKRSEHSLVEMPGKSRETRKRCKGCYESISQMEGSRVAANKARRVSTYCRKCDGNPFMCVTCFERLHECEF